VHVVPYVGLDEGTVRGGYLTPSDAATLTATLQAYLRDFVTFALDYGTRTGQLARTQRRFVDLDRGVIEWPPSECKAGEAHTVPLEGAGFDIVQRLMSHPPLHCPYLFHGPRCAPTHTPSKRYGCVGDFKKAWRTACTTAGFPVGRKHGGFVFHDTRRTAATNLRAGGMGEGDAMKITGHQTAHVFRRYDLDDVDALRQRLTRARTQAASVTRLRDTRKQRVARGQVAGCCTATAQQALATTGDVE
jgi:integrase